MADDAPSSPLPSVYTPSWKKPSDIMKQFRKRKRALQARIEKQCPYSQNSQPNDRVDSSTLKSRNPFRKNLPSEESVSSPEIDASSDTTLFEFLRPVRTLLECKSQETNTATVKPPSISSKDKRPATQEPTQVWESRLPMDWSLKTHVRLLSSMPFGWNASTLKTTEEASGVTGFVRCLRSGQGELDTSANAQLHQRCLAWMHPSLPWIELFPRNSERSFQSGFAADPKIQQALYNDWCTSLRSLFQLLRSRQCPYFYLCAPDFTVLFRAAGIAKTAEVHALIAPSTKGLRNALKDDGIAFSMPLQKHTTESSQVDDCFSEIPSNGIDPDDENEDVATWMENAGLEASSIFTASQKTIDLSDKKNDRQPQSLVYVEGTEVQALFNFLLNAQKLCVSKTGAACGVPATLLSPVGFKGGTLKSLSVKQNIVRSGEQLLHCLEMNGPILPHVIHSMAGLDSLMGHPSYSASFRTLHSTASFSSPLKVSSIPSAFATQGLLDCGLQPDILATLCSSQDSCTLQGFEFKSGSFRWKT